MEQIDEKLRRKLLEGNLSFCFMPNQHSENFTEIFSKRIILASIRKLIGGIDQKIK